MGLTGFEALEQAIDQGKNLLALAGATPQQIEQHAQHISQLLHTALEEIKQEKAR